MTTSTEDCHGFLDKASAKYADECNVAEDLPALCWSNGRAAIVSGRRNGALSRNIGMYP